MWYIAIHSMGKIDSKSGSIFKFIIGYIYLKYSYRVFIVKFSWNYKLNLVVFGTTFSNGILWWYLVQFPLSLIFLATFVAFVDILKIENPHKLSWIYLLQLHTYYFILSCGVICGIRNIMSLIFRNKKRTIRIKYVIRKRCTVQIDQEALTELCQLQVKCLNFGMEK